MSPSALGEFFGTFILIVLGNGVVAGVLLEKSKAQNTGWMAITTGWAIAVLLGVCVATALGAPGELNPAVTLANVILGSRTVTDAMSNIVAQFAGAMAGATLVWLHFLPHWSITPDQSTKLACFATAPAIRTTLPNYVSEIIGTFVLMFVATAFGSVAMQGERPATNFTPVLVGAVVWGVGLSLGGTTGYGINPARDLGPRIMHAILPITGKGDSDWSYAPVPVVGPIIGAALAALVWKAIH